MNLAALKQKNYIVKKSDTLYSIAFLAGMDYEELAAFNHIEAPYTLSIGQVLLLSFDEKPKQPSVQNSQESLNPDASSQTIFWSSKKNVSQTLAVEPVAKSATKELKTSKPVLSWHPHQKESLPNQTSWQWPVKGRVIEGFSLTPEGNRGINVGGSEGAPIKASAAGEVVYSGNGIHGYGNIIIVKNTRHFLSAYAYNDSNLVQQGQWVEQGQDIATMGHDLTGAAMLHFEIRYYGKAVDPMRYLSA